MDNEEAQVVCPKCGSDDVLVGTKDMPSKCSACGHKWKEEPAIITTETVTTGAIADVIGYMPPRRKKKKKLKEDVRIVAQSVITINRTPFEIQLDQALKLLEGNKDEAKGS